MRDNVQPPVTGGFGRLYTPSLRATFMHQIHDACTELGAHLRWRCDDWIAELTLGDRRQIIVGYTFAVNDSAAAELAIDKAATATVLAARGVPAVEHRVFTFGDLDRADAVSAVLADMALPAVVKPVRGSGGVDVWRALSPAQLGEVLAALSLKYSSIAVSPWVSAACEYRVVSADGSAELVFSKTVRNADPDEWRHSSDYGAWAEVVPHGSLRRRLADVAQQAMTALGLRAGAVDVLEDDEHYLHVIEVNDAFSLNHFSQQSDEHYALATQAYRAILDLGFRT